MMTANGVPLSECNVNRLSESTSGSSLRAPTRNPFSIGKVLGIPGQARDDGYVRDDGYARDDGRWTIFLNLLTFLRNVLNSTYSII